MLQKSSSDSATPTRRSATGRRLFIAFGSLIALYILAASFVLHGFTQIHKELAYAQQRVQGLELTLEFGNALRDQYAHMAHTIIIGDDSHAGFYRDASAASHALALRLQNFPFEPDEREWVANITRALAELDDSYHARILPGVLASATSDVQAEHGVVLGIVGTAQERVAQLANRLSESTRRLAELVETVQRRTVVFTLVFLVVAPLLAIVAGLLIGRSVARPLALLEAGARRMGDGDLRTRIPLSSPDEFGALAQQLNAMAASVEEHQRQRLLDEKLASIGRLAAGVAHELNNPLAVIRGYVRLLEKRGDPALTEELSVIQAEALRCQEIVEGLLDLSRPPVVAARPVDLRALADDVVLRLVDSNGASAGTLAVQGEGAALGDATKLRQVLVNLLKNGLEASPPHGQVTVEVSEVGNNVEVAVADGGPGFGSEVRERVFEPFFTTKPQGTGLGLAVSRAIARAHGGELLLAPVELGARVVLRLPRWTGGAA